MFFLLHNPSFWAAAITALVLAVLPVLVKDKRILPVIAAAAGILLLLAGYRTAALEALAAAVLWQYLFGRLRWYMPVAGGLLAVVLLCTKPGSSGGRWFILQQTAAMIQQQPGGVGIGRFAVEYGLQQAAYFRLQGTGGAAALLAGNTQFALNEYLQVTAEAGIAAGIFFLLCTLLLLRRGIQQYKRQPSFLLCCALAGFTAISAGNLTFYLLHNGWVLLLYGLCVFTVLLLQVTTPQIVLRCGGVLLAAGVVAAGIGTYREVKGKQLLALAGQLSMAGYRVQSDALFAAAKPYCSSSVNYHTALAVHCLRYNSPAAAIGYLRHAQVNQTHSDIFHLLGNAALRLGDTAQAICHYQAEVYTMPCLLAPRKKLADLYQHLRQPARERYWLQTIVQMPVKVPSAYTKYMLQQTEERMLALQHKEIPL